MLASDQDLMSFPQRPAAAASPCGVQLALLAADLTAAMARPAIELLGFPDVALRIQRLLAEEDVNLQRVISLLGSEPVLAGRVVGLANSAALNPRGRSVSELRTAVMRIGLDSLRALVMCHAFTQFNATQQLRPVRGLLRQSWQHSVVVAAVCAAFARRDARVNPDTALLAGLMHGVGRLYILVQARGYAELLTAPQQLEQIVGSWHRMIGRKLLQQWQIPDAIVASVTDGDWWDGQQAADTVQLSAVVCLATLLVRHLQDPEALERVLTESGLLTQCSVTLADVLELPAASEPDIAEAIALLDAQLA